LPYTVQMSTEEYRGLRELFYGMSKFEQFLCYFLPIMK